MTVGEALRVFDEGSFMDENGFVFGIDLSEGQDAPYDGYTALTDGVFFLSADLSPRTVMRDYVDGDRAVPLSRGVSVRVKLLLISGNSLQAAVISKCRELVPMRCVYMSCGGVLYSGMMLGQIVNVDRGSLYGVSAEILFRPC